MNSLQTQLNPQVQIISKDSRYKIPDDYSLRHTFENYHTDINFPLILNEKSTLKLINSLPNEFFKNMFADSVRLLKKYKEDFIQVGLYKPKARNYDDGLSQLYINLLNLYRNSSLEKKFKNPIIISEIKDLVKGFLKNNYRKIPYYSVSNKINKNEIKIINEEDSIKYLKSTYPNFIADIHNPPKSNKKHLKNTFISAAASQLLPSMTNIKLTGNRSNFKLQDSTKITKANYNIFQKTSENSPFIENLVELTKLHGWLDALTKLPKSGACQTDCLFPGYEKHLVSSNIINNENNNIGWDLSDNKNPNVKRVLQIINFENKEKPYDNFKNDANLFKSLFSKSHNSNKKLRTDIISNLKASNEDNEFSFKEKLEKQFPKIQAQAKEWLEVNPETQLEIMVLFLGHGSLTGRTYTDIDYVEGSLEYYIYGNDTKLSEQEIKEFEHKYLKDFSKHGNINLVFASCHSGAILA
ncbi:MAG: hypothetical protein HRT47_12515 [Candidatus Caenarcaniphilales bacterium]|nr:hypothetical protein [Candidatus Caenarcaniphilales bacterium]